MRLRITAALAALGLASCGYIDVNFGGDEGNASANQAGNAAAAAGGNQAQAADAGVTSSRSLQQLQGGGASGGKDPAAGGGAIDPAVLIGSWGDNGDCSNPTEIFADGTFRAPNGGEGNWRLEGNTLIATGPGGAATMQITSVTATELLGTDAQGAPGRSIRC
jgi:hypothetical protein